MIRRPPRSTLDRSSAASDVYKRQVDASATIIGGRNIGDEYFDANPHLNFRDRDVVALSLIHISEPTKPY